MKKTFSLLLILFLFTGCSNSVKCKIGEELLELKLKEGQVIEFYIDHVKQDKDVVDEVNSFIKGYTDNKKAKEKIIEVYKEYGGTCK